MLWFGCNTKRIMNFYHLSGSCCPRAFFLGWKLFVLGEIQSHSGSLSVMLLGARQTREQGWEKNRRWYPRFTAWSSDFPLAPTAGPWHVHTTNLHLFGHQSHVMTHQLTQPRLPARESERRLTILAKPESWSVMGCTCNPASAELPGSLPANWQ